MSTDPGSVVWTQAQRLEFIQALRQFVVLSLQLLEIEGTTRFGRLELEPESQTVGK